MITVKKMSAKKLRELLADAGVHNDYQLTKMIMPTPPIIAYRKTNRHQFARWIVARHGYKTDPEHGHFLDGYNKVFPITPVISRDAQLIRAREWASEKYGYTIDEWVKTPFGSWAPKDVLEAALRHHLYHRAPHLFTGENSAPTDDKMD